jgi:hypothetical protein
MGMLPDIGDTFKELVWDALIKAAIASLIKAVPFLGWGPAGAVLTWVVQKFTDYLYSTLVTSFNVAKMPFLNEAHRVAFDDATVKLRIIAAGEGINSDAFRKARDEHKKRLSEFVKFAS